LATLSLGGCKYSDLVLKVWGFDTGLKNLLCKNIIVVKYKEVKTGCKLEESSKEGYGSKCPVLPMKQLYSFQ
jgi:hypothetical protein